MKTRISFLIIIILNTCSFQLAALEQVPFGDRVSPAIFNYHRTTPYIATSGKISHDGLLEVKKLGFNTIIDLRTDAEGLNEERAIAESKGLRYINIPVDRIDLPEQKTIDEFAALVEDKNNLPVLIHCQTANRVGVIWALYRHQKGIAMQHAIEEAITIGMKQENAIRLLDLVNSGERHE